MAKTGRGTPKDGKYCCSSLYLCFQCCPLLPFVTAMECNMGMLHLWTAPPRPALHRPTRPGPLPLLTMPPHRPAPRPASHHSTSNRPAPHRPTPRRRAPLCPTLPRPTPPCPDQPCSTPRRPAPHHPTTPHTPRPTPHHPAPPCWPHTAPPHWPPPPPLLDTRALVVGVGSGTELSIPREQCSLRLDIFFH